MSARPVPLAPAFQAMHLCHSVFSCFSPDAEFHWRVVASEKFATLLPLFVVRISGSLPRFPMSMTLFRLRLTTPPQLVTCIQTESTSVEELHQLTAEWFV